MADKPDFYCERAVIALVIEQSMEAVSLTFSWWGGAYIEVAAKDHSPMEVINVWDYEADKPRIARTQEAFEAKVDDWIEEYGPESLVHDVTHNWSV